MIKKLYEKSKLWFALTWIIAYCVLASIGDALSSELGILKSVTLPILSILCVTLYRFVKKNGLSEIYGLCKPQIPASKLLYYSPLIVLLTANFWFGIARNASLLETVLYIASMLCVGFLEEMIFRGFLFKALLKNGVKSAVIVSSLTFGMGHIINLFNGSGAQFLPNILQILYAVAIGFTFVMLYYKTKSMLVCIAVHSLFNAASVFSNEAVTTIQTVVSAALIAIIAAAYAVYIGFAVKSAERTENDD